MKKGIYYIKEPCEADIRKNSQTETFIPRRNTCYAAEALAHDNYKCEFDVKHSTFKRKNENNILNRIT